MPVGAACVINTGKLSTSQCVGRIPPITRQESRPSPTTLALPGRLNHAPVGFASCNRLLDSRRCQARAPYAPPPGRPVMGVASWHQSGACAQGFSQWPAARHNVCAPPTLLDLAAVRHRPVRPRRGSLSRARSRDFPKVTTTQLGTVISFDQRSQPGIAHLADDRLGKRIDIRLRRAHGCTGLLSTH